MDLDLLLADIERKPETLHHLATCLLSTRWPEELLRGVNEVMIFGMGSSRYAAGFCARRLRLRRVRAWSDYSTAALEYTPGPNTLVVLVSAGGATAETLAAAEWHRGRCRTLALTNQPATPLAEIVDHTWPLLAGDETSGAVVRSMIHTILILEHLAEHLAGERPRSPRTAFIAADAVSSLLDARTTWLPEAAFALDSGDGVYFLAPVSRVASAQQSSLLIREVPRRPSSACEVADWSHVDVYLTKSQDYRAVLFGESEANARALEWLGARGATVVGVGMTAPEVQMSVRYSCDDDPLGAALVDTVIAELLAHHWGSGVSPRRSGGGEVR